MKIIKHGRVLHYQCKSCGCEWLAAKCESIEEKNDSGEAVDEFHYFYDCPECFQTTKGYFQSNETLK